MKHCNGSHRCLQTLNKYLDKMMSGQWGEYITTACIGKEKLKVDNKL